MNVLVEEEITETVEGDGYRMTSRLRQSLLELAASHESLYSIYLSSQSMVDWWFQSWLLATALVIILPSFPPTPALIELKLLL